MRLRNLEPAGRAAARTGFTLMELLVVVAILVVLVGVATPMYMTYLDQSKKKIARSNAVMLAGELKNFYVSHDDYPPQGDWSLLPLPPGKNPPLDPWGQQYHWQFMQHQTIDGPMLVPVVWSNGPNRISGDQDDIYSE
jgi:prepilin-type N-terminal cleavage/methylation domain-containing protein